MQNEKNFDRNNQAIKILRKGRVVSKDEAKALKQMNAVLAALQLFNTSVKKNFGKGTVSDIDFEEVK